GGILAVQVVAVLDEGEQVESWVVFINAQDANRVATVVTSAEKSGAFDIQRRNGLDARQSAGAGKTVNIETFSGDEGVLGFAEQDNVTVESAEDLDSTFEQRVKKAELHED
ncbi:MAG: hypothetical protein JF612_15330, partial [Planctomycetia bacterium]|nr:hypothetical protein [Planctomycetia bacterium]